MNDQPIYTDQHGVRRFKANAIVEYLLNNGPFDMNHLAIRDFSDADRAQFAQLIGYSVSGWGGLPYVSDEDWDRVHTPPAPATAGDKQADRARLLATVVRDLGGELLLDTDLETRPVLIEQRGDGWSVVLAPAPDVG